MRTPGETALLRELVQHVRTSDPEPASSVQAQHRSLVVRATDANGCGSPVHHKSPEPTKSPIVRPMASIR
ncbi:hypothetical protein PSAC2689_20267 [Paraburkholderia sacchari]